MALGEFELIDRYFRASAVARSDVGLSVGDDCALLRPQAGSALAVTVDTLVEGVHFLPDVDPESLGHKALAVNLSDLAAMGAEPAWVTLALTLPKSEESWLECFARGFLNLAKRHGVQLVGGDTTRGPLSITVQAMGFVPEKAALRRSSAQPGDGIYVTGDLGAAGLGLKTLLGESPPDAPEAVMRLLKPEPRVTAGLALRGLAHACIDISDGLAADLGHILEESGVGATLDWDSVPMTNRVRDYVAATGDWLLPLSAGDDYELCFTVPRALEPELAARSAEFGCPLTRIGRIEATRGLWLRRNGEVSELQIRGYQHFSVNP